MNYFQIYRSLLTDRVSFESERVSSHIQTQASSVAFYGKMIDL